MRATILTDPTLADGILDRLVHNAHCIEMRWDSMARGSNAAPSPRTPLPGSITKRLTDADHFSMIRNAQRRFAPTVIGITRNGDRHQIGMCDRHRRNAQFPKLLKTLQVELNLRKL